MIEFAYVGSVVPDHPPYNAPPFSRSANLFQTELIRGVVNLGLKPSLVLSFRTVPSFPKKPQMRVVGESIEEGDLPTIRLLGFINLTPFKQVMLGLSAFFFLTVWSLRRLGKPRLILVYNLTAPPGLFLWLAARLTGARICGLLCDIEVPGVTVPDSIIFRWDLRMHRFLIPRLDGRVVVAEATQQDFAPGQPFLLMEGGVSEDLIGRTLPEPARARLDEPFRMVAVGKLDETNGFDLMLEAMRHLSGEAVSLDIAGAGPLAKLVEEEARRDPRIRMHGFLDLAGVLALYRDADLILVIRKTQARNTRYFFPSKLMEALLSAVPVLATNTGHLRKVYGEYLFVLENETAEGLAQRILSIKLQSVEQRHHLGTEARAFMIREKHWRAQCHKIRDYAEALF
jgi:glycosyltransferase involved in cell wall biosynthesis